MLFFLSVQSVSTEKKNVDRRSKLQRIYKFSAYRGDAAFMLRMILYEFPLHAAALVLHRNSCVSLENVLLGAQQCIH